jgi:predicted GH43/DUF377 family glycosyl hydrolase
MPWIQRGVIFTPDPRHDWSQTHAQAPSAVDLGDRIRIYYGTRDARNKSRTSFFEVARDDPTRLLGAHDRPVLDLGKPGTFDEDGVIASHVMAVGDELWMYYGGVSTGGNVPYRMSIGLAVSRDGGFSFERRFEGPIVDRTPLEPYMTMAPNVLRDAGGWTMWYGSGVKWTQVADKFEPVYVTMVAHSDDGITWRRNGAACIRPRFADEANTRPAVLRTRDGYEMWFCHRHSRNYRDGEGSYRIGYAVSDDGVAWERLEAKTGLEPSGSGWNASTMAYPNVLNVDGRKIMFHNGDGFGQTGVGCALFQEEEIN